MTLRSLISLHSFVFLVHIIHQIKFLMIFSYLCSVANSFSIVMHKMKKTTMKLREGGRRMDSQNCVAI